MSLCIEMCKKKVIQMAADEISQNIGVISWGAEKSLARPTSRLNEM
jgi:hypothetical protein